MDTEESKYSAEVEKGPTWHRFRRLEILGDKVKKLAAPEDFFLRLFRDGCQHVEEIIIDSILKKHQLNDMVKGLFSVLQPQSIIAARNEEQPL